MKINKPHSKFKHLAIAVSLVFGLAACSDDDGPIAIEPQPPTPPPAPPANAAPVVSSTAVTSAEEDVLYSYTFTATDSDAGDTLVLASATLPGWLTFDVATGVLSGTPAASDVGDNAVSLTVTDGTATVTQDFTITVAAAPFVNTAPTFTSTGLAMGTVDTAYSYTATATDVDEGDTLSFSSVTLPPWATFDTGTAVLAGTPDVAGDYPVELSVTDGTDSTSQSFTITVAAASSNVALSIFETTERADWASWLCCNATTTGEVVTDEDATKDQVMQFTIDTDGGTVAGFTTREVDGAVGGMPFDASAFTSTGVLQFDLKLVQNGPAGAQPWFLKIESNADAGQFIQLPLTDANEAHSAPEVGVWQTYTFNLSDLGGSLDQSGIDLVMVFPEFTPNATGIVFKLDNVKILEDGASEPAPPPAAAEPTDLAISLYDTAERADWASWLCCNATSTGQVVIDADATKAEVMEFTIDTAGGTVAGFTARDVDGAVGGMPFDASAFTADGVLQFDLKLVQNGPAGAQPWFLKIESNADAGQFIQLPLTDANEAHSAPEVGVWQTYTFNLSDLGGSLDQSGIDLVMVFPEFTPNATGIVFRLDNVKVFRDGAGFGTSNEAPGPTGGIADVGDTGLVTNGGFETGTLDGWAGEGANINVELDDMGTYLAKLVAPEAQNPFIRQQRIGEGVITAGQPLTVSFDMKGTVEGGGGVVNAILFTEAPSGVSKTDNLLSVVPTADWTNYSYEVTAGDDTEWGVAILLQPACGAVTGCEVTVYFDNVVITAQ